MFCDNRKLNAIVYIYIYIYMSWMTMLIRKVQYALRESIHIRSFPGPNGRKYGPEKLRIQTPFTQ